MPTLKHKLNHEEQTVIGADRVHWLPPASKEGLRALQPLRAVSRCMQMRGLLCTDPQHTSVGVSSTPSCDARKTADSDSPNDGARVRCSSFGEGAEASVPPVVEPSMRVRAVLLFGAGADAFVARLRLA